MRGKRTCVLGSVLVGLALVCVGLRAEQTRRTAEILELESKWVQLRQERWAMQARAARMRAPNRLHARLRSMDSALQLPSPVRQPENSMRFSYDFSQP